MENNHSITRRLRIKMSDVTDMSMCGSTTASNEAIATDEEIEKVYLLFKLGFAQRAKEIVSDLAQKYCYGCEVDHPSQTHHSCIMQSEIEHFYRHRDEAFKSVVDNDLVRIWMDVIAPAKISDKLKQTFFHRAANGQIVFEEEKVFAMMERMIRLDDRLNWI